MIEGVRVVEGRLHTDERGAFYKAWQHEPGTPPMAEANHAERRAGCLVGLHFHRDQTDVWWLSTGRAVVYLVDLRVGSPTERAVQRVDWDVPGRSSVVIPPGVAHGFAALTDVTLTYLQSRPYDPADELGVAWDDPDLALDWPTRTPLLSERDRTNPAYAALRDLPRFA
ncbi:MAG: dTDP-4-dehydrorhamnose 3,5-epimerase [Frankiaceae bacterium]|nr:dTDP-4-dehydrorhamnose 3,5-epimerase [Frankiaceae bacterium]